jgi:hypothetical protein
VVREMHNLEARHARPGRQVERDVALPEATSAPRRALAALADIRSLRRSSSSIASGSPGGVAYDGAMEME